ncbi:class I SAM-dependent methyltransferase [Arenibacterium halophilum]|uniref:Class I SAM-dependent methyltransferase n=1 Tax=Arenibacterium halophilum TaxID=2583821 RepID=A0ABY2X7C5_9RHOB|nr:SAM-dependent methyltransferase [Arenibacterium halophilum]TMV11689.1 class I SAM-dependent methyltransferase [Arenibacterium halophilum]
MSLHDIIAARIRQDGPISMADYMADCLLHPTHGYYTTRDPLGAAGDFITAPEISQMFGELIGLALAQTWLDQGAPAPFTLAELGPGRGTLMADALRAAARVPGFAKAARIVLVEASPVLRDIQRSTLAGVSPEWIDTPDALPDLPLFAIANEFFDALPVRQFERGQTGWHELRVGLEGDRLLRGRAGEAPQPALDHRLDDTQPGHIVELCPQSARIAESLAARIAARGGAALIVDYGDWRSLGDTVQALRAHAPVDVFDAPGQADLTAHVDFESLAQASRRAGCSHSRVTPQGVFLERLGITQRAQSLVRARPDQADAIAAAHRRLTHPEEMGNLFKVIAIQPETATPPPGLMP